MLVRSMSAVVEDRRKARTSPEIVIAVHHFIDFRSVVSVLSHQFAAPLIRGLCQIPGSDNSHRIRGV
jgi:hypothetical protein